MESTGIYIHIPFCKSKCIYCDFYSRACSEDVMEAYLRALLQEIRLRGDSSLPVDTVYIGGGTPSHFGFPRLIRILETVEKHFCLLPGCEVTFEANPESVTLEGLSAMKASGFNRVSMGVQSFSDADLINLRRAHGSARAFSAVEAAKDAGFDNVSIDLIFGLPGQNMDSWRENLCKAVSLPITHISCYGLIPEPGTPLVSSPLMNSLPNDDMQADMYLECVEFLKKAGFEQYEISNFAKNGMVSRHNLRYWQLRPYIGLGAAAHSDFGGKRSSNMADIDGYIAAVEQGRFPFDSQEEISPAERRREQIMLALRTTAGINCEMFNYSQAFMTLANKYSRHGLGTLHGRDFSLTPGGFMVSNGIINEFLSIC